MNYDLSKIEEILKKYNKDLTSRAESLTIEEFIEISNNL
jgi:16S rRNA A1518/A1519 N6-dimethyltransferase RsmA/KsgA/DIM1 with predicted DNA glycosylase/AP lyase activity